MTAILMETEMIMTDAMLAQGATPIAPPADSSTPRPAEGRGGPDAELAGLAQYLGGANALDLVIEMAHDLRSPLSAILFLSEALQRGESGEVNPTQKSQLGLIYSAALCLCSTASDVLEMARGGTRLLDPAPVPFSLGDVRNWVRDLVLPMAEQRGVELELSTPEPDRRMGHPRALSRVLLNLATNALKATEHGSVRLTGLPNGNGWVRFTVEDTGPGMDEATVRTLFQPWRKRTAYRSQFSGTGLGLTICRRLVTAMGSSIQVESAPGRGTRFWFDLPLPAAAA
jgi:signal transduction histidine kinase